MSTDPAHSLGDSYDVELGPKPEKVADNLWAHEVSALRELLVDLEGMRNLLTDSAVTSVRIVLNLEKMVVKEAKRAYTYLSLFGYLTDAVVVNRILPEGLSDEFFRGWQKIHSKYQVEVESSFAPLPILTVPLFDTEVIGLELLSRMADSIYGDGDPSQRLYLGNPQ